MIKTLSKSIREYKWVSLLTPLFIIIEVVMETFIVFKVRDLINLMQQEGGIGQGDMGAIGRLSLELIIMAMIALVSGIANGITGARASAGFSANLRHDVFHKIQDFSFENIDSFQTSSLITRLTTDIANLQQSYQMTLRISFRVPFQMIFAIIMSFKINSELAWIFVIALPILAAGLALIIYNVMPIARRVFKRYDKLNNGVEENIKGIRVVKAYVREDYEVKKFNRNSEELRNDFIKAEKILALNNPLMQMIMQTCIILICFFSAKTITSNHFIFMDKISDMKVGDLSSLITFGIMMLTGIMMLSMIFVMFSMSIECGERVCEVLNTETTLKNKENPVMEVKDGSVTFKDVNFKYALEANKYALYDIDLKIKSGETVGIIGGTGSSKTTLVNLISRLYDVTSGEVLVGGVDVKDYDLETLRNQVAVVLQNNVLFSGSIVENLRWGNKDASLDEIKEACKLAQASDFIEAFPHKYETHIEQGGTNVSGGQKQRLCIARALLKKPKILILDDSTSAVDTKTDAYIRQGLKEYLPKTTKIIIAQRISSVCEADKIIVLEDGTINGIGTHEELLKNNKIYQEVYYSQNKVGDLHA